MIATTHHIEQLLGGRPAAEVLVYAADNDTGSRPLGIAKLIRLASLPELRVHSGLTEQEHGEVAFLSIFGEGVLIAAIAATTGRTLRILPYIGEPSLLDQARQHACRLDIPLAFELAALDAPRDIAKWRWPAPDDDTAVTLRGLEARGTLTFHATNGDLALVTTPDGVAMIVRRENLQSAAEHEPLCEAKPKATKARPERAPVDVDQWL